MRTRRCGVHICRADCSVQRALVNLSFDFFIAAHRVKDGTLDVDALLRILSDFESLLRSLLNLLEEIVDLLVVDLNHGNLNGVLTEWIILLAFLNSLENLLAGLRDDTLILAIADDRIALARSCLTIREQASIEPSEGVVQNFLTLTKQTLVKRSIKLRLLTRSANTHF